MSEEVTCPVCGEFSGAVSAVKGHITGRRAEGDPHEGKTGGQYDDLLAERASDESTTDSDSSETAAEAAEEGGEDEDDQEADGDADENEEEDEDDMPTQEEYKQQADGDSNDGGSDGGSDGDAPAPDSGAALDAVADMPTMWIVAAVVLVAVIGYLMLNSSEDRGESVDAGTDGDTAEANVQEGGFGGEVGG